MVVTRAQALRIPAGPSIKLVLSRKSNTFSQDRKKQNRTIRKATTSKTQELKGKTNQNQKTKMKNKQMLKEKAKAEKGKESANKLDCNLGTEPRSLRPRKPKKQ